ncbi:MAG: glutamyl-tRNA reductase, partial [Acidimicrobiales bacterium]
MAVVVVGIHEWDAPLDLFERVAISDTDLAKALAELAGSPHLSEAVVLSTCMRTEVYAVVERFHDGLGDIEDFFSRRLGATRLAPDLEGSSDPRLEPSSGTFDLGMLTCWYDDAAVSHLFEVAAGIDSTVLGEGEVLRQVRDAAGHARTEGAAGPVLTPLFRHAVETGKRARTETAIQRGTTSLAGAVVDLAEQAAGRISGRNVLVVGAGEMATGIARLLAGRGESPKEVVVANRGPTGALAVANIVGGRAAGLEDLDGLLDWADVVLTSTGSDELLVGPELLGPVLDRRGPARGPLVVV